MKTTVNLDGFSRSCQLVNVSATGALIAASFHPRIGSEVELDVPGMGWATASVIRVTSAYIALSFDQPIDVTVVGVHRLAGGKIVEGWRVLDRLDLVHQIGAVD